MGDLSSVSSKQWMITINNPLEHGYSHEQIRTILGALSSLEYWCMCDEEGGTEKTYHTHVYLHFRNKATAQRIENLFPKMNRQVRHRSPKENRAYILKDGEKFGKDESGEYHYIDWKGDEHFGINHSDTFEEFGEPIVDKPKREKQSDKVLEMIKEGASNEEIILAFPSVYKDIEKVERARSVIRDSKFSSVWRDLSVVYMFGATGVGKTRSVMEGYGYSSCYRVTDYKHPFDSYNGEDVILFEEFRSSLKCADMLKYLDGYPLLLPCRYFNRQACYTKVYIISNIAPDEQYKTIDRESKNAFYRRITQVLFFDESGRITKYDSVKQFLERYDWVKNCQTSMYDEDEKGYWYEER